MAGKAIAVVHHPDYPDYQYEVKGTRVTADNRLFLALRPLQSNNLRFRAYIEVEVFAELKWVTKMVTLEPV